MKVHIAPYLCTAVAVLFMAGCDSSSAFEQTVGVPASIVVVSGNQQQSLVDEELPAPLVARVVDPEGVPVSDWAIAWIIMQGGGRVDAGVGRTDAQGYALERWTLGPNPGVQTLEIRAMGESGQPLASRSFTALAVADEPPPPAAISTVTVSPQSASVQVGATTQLSAVTRDEQGNILTGRSVTWSSGTNAVASVNASGVVTGVSAGTATITAASEGRSGSAGVTVTTTSPPPSGNALFQSDWSTATGTSYSATMDGGAWDQIYCQNQNGVGTVVAGSTVGWTLTPNVLRVRDLTSHDCFQVAENLEGAGLAVGQDYYVGMYIRNDATGERGQIITLHPVPIWVAGDIQAVLWSNQGAGNTTHYQWQVGIGHTTTNGGTWGTADRQWGMDLPVGQWFRFAWHIDFVNVRATSADVRIWPRVYDMAGNLLYDARNLRRTWVPSDPQTLQQWYDAGHMFIFDQLSNTRQVGVGTEGPAAARNSGQAWYYGALQIRTDTWPLPR